MQDGLMAEAAQALMSVNDLDLFPNYNIPKDREEREDRWHRCLAIDDQKRHMINFKAIRQVSDARAALISMGYNDNFMAPVDKFLAHDESWSPRNAKGRCMLTVDNW